MNKKIRLVCGYILLFIESVLLCLLVLCLIFNFTFLNKEYVLKRVKKADAYSTLFNSIKTEMSYYTEQSGFEDNILDDIFTIEEVTNEFNKFINGLYDNKKITIDSVKFRERLNTKIDNYIEKNNFKIVNEEEIEAFVDKMAEIYENKIIINEMTSYLKSIIQNIRTKVNIIVIVLSVVTCVSIVVNMTIFKRKDLSVIFFFLAFMFLVMNIYIKNVIDLKHLFVYNQVVTDPLRLIVNDNLVLFIWISIISFVIGILLSIFEKDKMIKK